jgi:hypothetical protein
MAGCFGNSDIDKWLERQVDAHNGNELDNNTDSESDSDDDLYGDDDDL